MNALQLLELGGSLLFIVILLREVDFNISNRKETSISSSNALTHQAPPNAPPKAWSSFFYNK